MLAEQEVDTKGDEEMRHRYDLGNMLLLIWIQRRASSSVLVRLSTRWNA